MTMLTSLPNMTGSSTNGSDQGSTLPPEIQLLQMITGYWVSQSIYAAAKLGLADQLQAGPQAYTHLAAETATQPQALYRLLRALASVGIFAETEPGWFALTPLATYLQSDVPGSLRDASIMMGDPEHYGSWGQIIPSITTGDSGFEHLYGMNVFAFYAQNPEPAAVFDRAMTSFSGIENAAVVEAYDFSSLGTISDIAGGHGSLLLQILQANPDSHGILFDQPDVIERATTLSLFASIQDRCQLVAGDFFAAVPAGADAYLLKHIIHDWDDERSIAILKSCRQAMSEHSKLLLVEMVIPPGNEPAMGKLLDMNMLVMCPGGKERTAQEYQTLLAAAGFELTRIVPTASLVSIIEGVPMP